MRKLRDMGETRSATCSGQADEVAMAVRTATSRRRLSALTLQLLHCAFDDLPASRLHDFAPLTSGRLSRDAGSPNRGAGLALPPSSSPRAPSSHPPGQS